MKKIGVKFLFLLLIVIIIVAIILFQNKETDPLPEILEECNYPFNGHLQKY